MNACTVIPLVDLNGRVKFPNVLRADARDYRSERNLSTDAIVVFHGAEIQGSMSELGDAAKWPTGSVGVDAKGSFFEACGNTWARVRA